MTAAWGLARGDALAPRRRVIRRLGGGATHEVFLVDTRGPPGRAAAKLPRPHLAEDPHVLLGLRDEGRALAQLVHPAVPRSLDTVLVGPYPHLLLEYLPGPTLHDVLMARRPLSPVVVAALGGTLARALAHIAAAGWVHLDVKPSNIALGATPCLLDFELARPVAEAARMRKPTGTWAYMPPEQRAAGSAHAPQIGPAADVYALAASLREALAGRLLESSSLRRPAPAAGRVGALLDAALAPAPRDRPTAAELAAGLAGDATPGGAVAGAPTPLAVGERVVSQPTTVASAGSTIFGVL